MIHRALLLALGSLTFSVFAAHAEEAAPPKSPAVVEFDLLVVQMPESDALPLVRELRDPKLAAAAADKVIGLVSAKKANLIAWPFLATKNGQRAIVEQIDEFRYATEYDPSGNAKIVETKPAESAPANPPTVPVDPVTPPPTVDSHGQVTTTISESEGVPTSFETRNTGVTFEVSPTIAEDGETIDLSMAPQHVALLRMLPQMIEDQKTHKKTVVEQPEFVTNKVTTSIRVRNGDTTLLGVFKVPEPKGTMELFILHTQIKPSKR